MAIPVDNARICINTLGEKPRFQVADSAQHGAGSSGGALRSLCCPGLFCCPGSADGNP